MAGLPAWFRPLRSRRHAHRDTAQKHELSWREARQAAADWLASIGYSKKRDVRGEFIDLQPFGPSLKQTGPFREMVLNAAARLLRRRGAASVILPE